MNIELEQGEIRLILELLKYSDPLGFYTRKLQEKIIKQSAPMPNIEQIEIKKKE